MNSWFQAKRPEILDWCGPKGEMVTLDYAEECGNVSYACRKYIVSRDTFDRWKKQRENHGIEALANAKPCPENPAVSVAKEIEEKILYVRKKFGLGPQRISWYLDRHYGLTVLTSGAHCVLCSHRLNRLPKGASKRTPSTFKRYEKTVPGHQVQIDVKFLTFFHKKGRKVRLFQYTAIDDATGSRAQKVYTKHTQANTIKFLDYVISKFPFHIKYVQTDNGQEFQSKFHWHAEDCVIIHHYIKPAYWAYLLLPPSLPTRSTPNINC